MEKVSIVIPVFKESPKLEKLFTELLKDNHKQKEIITVIDEPTEKSINLSKKYKRQVKFIFNQKRIGKVTAVNLAAKKSSGDILFFMDCDNTLNNANCNLIGKIIQGMNGSDYGILKIVSDKKDIISKMIYYEFINVSFINYIFSKYLKKTPYAGGQAFVIRKEVWQELGGFKSEIVEDLDICTRAFLKGKKFSYMKDLEVMTETPNSWGQWINQRSRWNTGATLWLKKYYKPLMKNTVAYPNVFISSIFASCPTILLFLLNFVFSNSLLERGIYFGFLLISLKYAETLPFIFLLFSSIALFKSALLYFIAFMVSCCITYATARKMNFKFNLIEYTLFYFFYAPLNLLFYFMIAIKSLILSPEIKDWKV